MDDAICLTTPDGLCIELPASKIVGIYPFRLGSIVAVERSGGCEWTEHFVDDPSGVVFQKWRAAKPIGVTCLDDWLGLANS